MAPGSKYTLSLSLIIRPCSSIVLATRRCNIVALGWDLLALNNNSSYGAIQCWDVRHSHQFEDAIIYSCQFVNGVELSFRATSTHSTKY